MAVGKFDLTAASGVLKRQFDPHDAYKILTSESAFLGQLKRENGVLVGDDFEFSIQYGTPRGVSTSYAKAAAGASTSLYKKMKLTRGRIYGRGSIDRETMKVAQTNKQSFANTLEREQDGVLLTMQERCSSWAFGNGGGACGKIGAISGSTITLSNPNDHNYFQENGLYEISATDGLTGAVRAGGTLTCSSVDRDTGIITFTAGVVATIGGAIVGDYVFPNGDHAAANADAYGPRVIVGLAGWLPLTAPDATLFFGMDRSKDTTRLGGCRYTGGVNAPIEETIQGAVANFANKGANKIDTVIMNGTRYQELLISLGSKVIYSDSVNKETGVGFTGVKIATPNGMLTVFGDRACPTDRAYFLQKDTWSLLTMDEFPQLDEEDGLSIRKALDGTDSYTWDYMGYAQIGCRMPGKNGVAALLGDAMADTKGVTHYPLQSRNREEKRIALKFFPQGASDLDSTTNVGYGAVVTRTNVGKFTVVFDKPYNRVVPLNPSVGHATLVLHARVISTETDANGGVTGFTVQVYTAANPGVAADVAAAATSWVSVEAIVLDTGAR